MVVVQEVKASLFDTPPMASRALMAGYKALFNCHNPASAGVAIFYRSCLHNLLTFSAERRDNAGRLLAVQMDWGGHKLLLACLYAPNLPAEAAPFYATLPTQLGPVGNRHLILTGDFNFVEDANADRIRSARVGAADGTNTPNDAACTPVFRAKWPALVDTFRHLHPASGGYTCTGWWGASRLDRFYVPPALLPYVMQCTAGPPCRSDHRLVRLTLSAATPPPTTGPGRRRLRMHFWRSPSLREDLRAWLLAEVDGAPLQPGALLAWWPGFKKRLFTYVQGLNQQTTRPPSGPAWQAARDAYTALEEAYAAVDEGDAGAVDLVTQRQATYNLAVAAAQRATATDAKPPPPWLHLNERPSPATTSRVRPHASRTYITALRDASGQLVGPGVAQANAMAAHFAQVSTSPAPSPQATATVLHAVRTQGNQLRGDQAAALGGRDVTTREVKEALKHSQPGKAPGLDGIPVELYRRYSDVLIPLLASLYSAIGMQEVVPPGFLDGIITALPKGGDATLPANYRPITLLNTDYRVLAKVLANRLLECLSDVISPSQSAFLKNRGIGNNIMLLQLAPHVLAQQQQSAVVAFLDIAKAYDTVHRDFLRETMRAMGAGDDFIAWVDLLLSGTFARAEVNGFISGLHAFTAGVRQGCPLAPLLYLFVAEALFRFLRGQGVGITLGNTMPLVAGQFADDTHTFLPNFQAVPTLLGHLDTYKAASGQATHPGKSRLLVIGHIPPGTVLPQQMAGIPVVTSATALGLAWQQGVAPPKPKKPWGELILAIETVYTRIAGMPLSAFGRAFAANGYGISRILYAAEFVGLPPPAMLNRLTKATSRLVDSKRGANSPGRFFPGVRWDLLTGHPTTGGFGVLPWEQHIRARHAVWAARLLSTPPESMPWVQAAFLILPEWVGAQALRTPYTPLHHLVGRFSNRGFLLAPLAPPLDRLLGALACLPHVTQLSPLPGGAWRQHLPVVHNPLLAQLDHTGTFSSAIDGIQQMVLVEGHATTVEGLLHFHETLQQGPAIIQPHRSAVHVAHSNNLDERELLDTVRAMLPADMLPPQGTIPWPSLSTDPAIFKAGQRVVPHLGWVLPDDTRVPLPDLTVKVATLMQLSHVTTERQRRMQVFVQLALHQPTADLVRLCTKLLAGTLRRLWRLRWANHYKEVYWRLVLDGHPTCERMHIQPQQPAADGGGGPDPGQHIVVDGRCLCGADMPGRLHHFWQCPAARAVVAELERCIGRPSVCRSHLWLIDPPAGVPSCIWPIVCLSALKAMWVARGLLLLPERRATMRGSPAAVLLVAQRRAVAAFWSCMHDFTVLGKVPQAWRRLLPAGTPFLHFPQQAGRLRTNRPAPAPAAADGD